MPKPKALNIKTAILVDMMGSDFGNNTPEMEIAEHVKNYGELLKPAKLDWYRIHCFDESVLKPGTQLVLFDFGGMMAGNSLTQDNSRALVKWADANPSALVIVASSFTYRNSVKWEMEDLGLDLPNILDGHGLLIDDQPIPDWFKKQVGL